MTKMDNIQLSEDQIALRQRIREERAFRAKYEKYKLYTPIGKVEEFINITFSGKYLATALLAANGIGKTVAGVNMIAHLIWSCGNKYFQAPLYQNWKFPKKGRIISDPNTIRETIIPTMKEWFPKQSWKVDRYETTKDGKQYEAHWVSDTGWEITLMTYEQDVKEFESATLGFVWFDEPPPEAIYKANIARLRMGGIAWITATPLAGSAYMYDTFVTPPPEEMERNFKAYLESDVEEACKLHGIRGFLNHDQIVKMISQYDPDDMQARVFGKFQHLTGLVYKSWNRKIHVIEPFTLNEKDFVVISAIDPHPRTADALAWYALDRQLNFYIVYDIFEGFASAKDMALRIKKVEDENHFRVVKRIIDPSAFIINQHDEYKKSLANELAAEGLTYVEGSKERVNAIKKTKAALHYQLVGSQLLRPPQLLCFNTASRHIWEFEHWQWEDWRGKTAQYKGLKEKPMDKDDHMMENVGRALLENQGFIEMERPPLYIVGGTVADRLDPYD